jgi:ectoine hydroxylase
MVLVTSPDTYQSRIDTETTILARQDPIVYSEAGPAGSPGLSQHQLKSYQKNGFVLMKGLFSEAEAAVFLAEANRMCADPDIGSLPEAIAEPGGTEVRSVFRVHRLNELYRKLSCDARLVGIAQQILGSEVYIHQSRVNLKTGFFGKEFYWHSDFETWHVEDGMPRMRALSCTVLLTENNEYNGPLMLMPGSHKHFISCVGQTPDDHYKQSLRKQEYGIADPAALKFLADRGGLQSMKGPAGSVVFFDCNTMHGSNSNISPYPRANLFMVYNSVENRLQDPPGGLKPRPEFIAAREDCEATVPLEHDYSVGS